MEHARSMTTEANGSGGEGKIQPRFREDEEIFDMRGGGGKSRRKAIEEGKEGKKGTEEIKDEQKRRLRQRENKEDHKGKV